MSRTGKLLLLAATLWPLIYIFLFMGSIFIMVLTMSTTPGPGDKGHSEPGGLFTFFPILMLAHLLTMLWQMGLLVFYIYNVFVNDSVAKDKKALWAVVLFFGNAIAMPIYWYLYLWQDPEPPLAV